MSTKNRFSAVGLLGAAAVALTTTLATPVLAQGEAGGLRYERWVAQQKAAEVVSRSAGEQMVSTDSTARMVVTDRGQVGFSTPNSFKAHSGEYPEGVEGGGR